MPRRPMMKWTLIGKLIDVGDLPTGTGFVMEVGDKTVTVTGLDQSMVQWLAKSYGENIGIGFDSNEDLKRRSAGDANGSPVVETHPLCFFCGHPLAKHEVNALGHPWRRGSTVTSADLAANDKITADLHR